MLCNEMPRLLETQIISFSVNLESSWNWINKTDSISSELHAEAQQLLLKRFKCALLRKYVWNPYFLSQTDVW